MKISINARKNTSSVTDVALAIEKAFKDTRFVINYNGYRRMTHVRNGIIDLGAIRLDRSKAYCGNHPSACRRPHTGPHVKRSYLEGADWVEFNDRLNDVLDQFHVDATVGKVVVIRKGKCRCVAYKQNVAGSSFQNDDWKRVNERYEDWCGKPNAPRSDIPPETPGYHDQTGYAESTAEHDLHHV